MMVGSQMELELDGSMGQSVGSRIRLRGKMLGVKLWVDEMVTERVPPSRKVWETTSPPRLLVIGEYRMGFEIEPQSAGSKLTVFIDYALPRGLVGRCLGSILGGFYSTWCTRRMAHDAAAHFNMV